MSAITLGERGVCLTSTVAESADGSAFDVANHFAEWTFNYTHTEAPFYTYRQEDYPNDAQQRNFIASLVKRVACEAKG
jgi:hypothetical protein